MEIIEGVLIFLNSFVLAFILAGLKRLSNNVSDWVMARKTEYEEEKGKNLATKEDIEEITKKIELVKAEISFDSSWKHNHIVDRENRLENILLLVERIKGSLNRIIVYSYNDYYIDKLFGMVDELNDYSIRLTNEGERLFTEYSKMNDLKAVSTLVEVSNRYAMELSCLASNVAVKLRLYQKSMDLAWDSSRDLTSRNEFMKKALDAQNEAQKLPTQSFEFREGVENAVNEYIVWFYKKRRDGSLMDYPTSCN